MAGQTVATGLISVTVATLTEGVIKAMMSSKLKTVVTAVLAMGLMVTGAGVFTGGMETAQGQTSLEGASQVRSGPASKEQKKDGDAKNPKDDAKLLQGTWKVTSAEFDGQADDDLKDAKLIISGREFHLVVADEEKFKVQPEVSNFGIHVGDFTIDAAKKPKTMDLRQGGSMFRAVYALDGDELKLCVNRHGDSHPEELTAKAGSQMTLLVLKRVPVPRKNPREPGEKANEGKVERPAASDKNMLSNVKQELFDRQSQELTRQKQLLDLLKVKTPPHGYRMELARFRMA